MKHELRLIALEGLSKKAALSNILNAGFNTMTMGSGAPTYFRPGTSELNPSGQIQRQLNQQALGTGLGLAATAPFVSGYAIPALKTLAGLDLAGRVYGGIFPRKGSTADVLNNLGDEFHEINSNRRTEGNYGRAIDLATQGVDRLAKESRRLTERVANPVARRALRTAENLPIVGNAITFANDQDAYARNGESPDASFAKSLFKSMPVYRSVTEHPTPNN